MQGLVEAIELESSKSFRKRLGTATAHQETGRRPQGNDRETIKRLREDLEQNPGQPRDRNQTTRRPHRDHQWCFSPKYERASRLGAGPLQENGQHPLGPARGLQRPFLLINVGPCMISARTGFDHGRHHAWGWEEGNNLT